MRGARSSRFTRPFHWTLGREVLTRQPSGPARCCCVLGFAGGWVRAAPVAGLTVGRESGTLGVMTSTRERMAIDHVAQRLSAQFCTLDVGLVARVVWDTHRHFDTHPTREFVPILVEDAARDRLRVMRSGTGSRSRERPGRGR